MKRLVLIIGFLVIAVIQSLAMKEGNPTLENTKIAKPILILEGGRLRLFPDRVEWDSPAGRQSKQFENDRIDISRNDWRDKTKKNYWFHRSLNQQWFVVKSEGSKTKPLVEYFYDYEFYNNQGQRLGRLDDSPYFDCLVFSTGTIAIGGLSQGLVNTYSPFGQLVKTTPLSEWQEIPVPEEEVNIFTRWNLNRDGSKIVIVRTSSILADRENQRWELMVIDVAGNTLFKKEGQLASAHFPGLSGRGDLVAVVTVTPLGPVDRVRGFAREIAVEMYDVFSGQRKWKTSVGTEGMAGPEFSDDDKKLFVRFNTGRLVTLEVQTGQILKQ